MRRRLSRGRFVPRPALVETSAARDGDVAVSDTNAAGGETPVGEPAKTPFEAEGYAADPLLLGRALYRQARYQEAIEVLKPQKGEPDGRYWIARSLEKLGKNDEAIEAYGAVIAMPEAAHLSKRASEDIEFLKWRMEFEKSDGGARSR